MATLIALPGGPKSVSHDKAYNFTGLWRLKKSEPIELVLDNVSRKSTKLNSEFFRKAATYFGYKAPNIVTIVQTSAEKENINNAIKFLYTFQFRSGKEAAQFLQTVSKKTDLISEKYGHIILGFYVFQQNPYGYEKILHKYFNGVIKIPNELRQVRGYVYRGMHFSTPTMKKIVQGDKFNFEKRMLSSWSTNIYTAKTFIGIHSNGAVFRCRPETAQVFLNATAPAFVKDFKKMLATFNEGEVLLLGTGLGPSLDPHQAEGNEFIQGLLYSGQWAWRDK